MLQKYLTLTLREAIQYFNSLDDIAISENDEVVCLLPESSVDTDEEDSSENDLDDSQPVDGSENAVLLTRKNEAEAEIKTEPQEKNSNCNLSQNVRQKRMISQLSDPSKRRKLIENNILNESDERESSNREKECIYNWNQTGEILPIEKESILTLEESHPHLFSLSPYELFRKYFDDDMLQFIVDETVRYARQKNDLNFNLTIKDMEKFLGIVLFTSYHHLPQEEMYWSRADDCSTPLVYEAMSRQNFRDIKKYLHLCNNDSLDLRDKLVKVRRFLDMFCHRLQQFGIFSENLNVGDEMIPYTGKQFAKIYSGSKTVKIGFKLWVLASSDGYPFNLKVFTGNENTPDSRNQLPLGTRVVFDLIPCVTNPKCHTIYVNSFFNSLTLLKEMRDKGFRTIGTISESRLQRCPLRESKEVKKDDRSAFVKISTREIFVVKFNDNRDCYMASNFESIGAIRKKRKWCFDKKKKIEVDEPYIVSNYNANKGGVNSLVRSLNQYRPKIVGTKWWWPFFTNTLSMAVVAAWKIKCKGGEKLSLLDFLRSVTIALIKKEDCKPPRQTGPLPYQCNDVRFDGVNHFIEGGHKQSKCKLCKKNTRLQCIKCKINLHKDCSYIYHTR